MYRPGPRGVVRLPDQSYDEQSRAERPPNHPLSMFIPDLSFFYKRKQGVAGLAHRARVTNLRFSDK